MTSKSFATCTDGLNHYELVCSYVLDYENSKNPFRERQEQIKKWHSYACDDIIEDEELVKIASKLNVQGIKNIDSLHIACAIKANADFFLTTDDGVLKKSLIVKEIKITDPVGLIKEVST